MTYLRLFSDHCDAALQFVKVLLKYSASTLAKTMSKSNLCNNGVDVVVVVVAAVDVDVDVDDKVCPCQRTLNSATRPPSGAG